MASKDLLKETTGLDEIASFLSKPDTSIIHTCVYDNKDDTFTLIYVNEGDIIQERTYPNRRVFHDEIKKIPYPDYSKLYGPLTDQSEEPTDEPRDYVKTKEMIQTKVVNDEDIFEDRKEFEVDMEIFSDTNSYHELRFIEWQQRVKLTPNDVYVNGGIDNQTLKNSPGFIFKRLNFYHYRPIKYTQETEILPLFVILNSPPFSPLVSHNLCEAFSNDKAECISIDCTSASKSFLYGDYIHAIQESKYQDLVGDEYNIFDWINEVDECAKIIANIYRGSRNMRPIVIISDLYTTYYATVLSGTKIIKECGCSKIVCIYLSLSVFPENFDNQRILEPFMFGFANTTEAISKLTSNRLKDMTLNFVKSIVPSKRENKNKLLNKQILEDMLFNVSLRSFPEKAFFLESHSNSYQKMDAALHSIFTNDKTKQSNHLYIYFKEPHSNGKPFHVIQSLFNGKLEVVNYRIDLLDINKNPRISVHSILSVLDHYVTNGMYLDLNIYTNTESKVQNISVPFAEIEQSEEEPEQSNSSMKNLKVTGKRIKLSEHNNTIYPHLNYWHKLLHKKKD